MQNFHWDCEAKRNGKHFPAFSFDYLRFFTFHNGPFPSEAMQINQFVLFIFWLKQVIDFAWWCYLNDNTQAF